MAVRPMVESIVTVKTFTITVSLGHDAPELGTIANLSGNEGQTFTFNRFGNGCGSAIAVLDL